MPRPLRNVVSATFVICLVMVPAGALAQAPVVDLQIAPSQVELQIGERKSLLVTAYDGIGNVVPNARFEWSTEESVIRVQHDPSSPNILYLNGVGYGVTAITVRSGRVATIAQIRVANAAGGVRASGPAAVLRFDPPVVRLLPTEERQIAPQFLRADGAPALSQGVQWRSLQPIVATVDGSGMIVGISTGRGLLEATAASGLTARVRVEVEHATLGFARRTLDMAPSAVDTVRMIVPAHENRLVGNDQFVWTSTAQQVATVSPVGVVTAIRAGSAEIVVTGFGQQHRLPVTVRPVEPGGQAAATSPFNPQRS